MDSTLAILKSTVKKDQTASIFVNVTILDIAPVYIGDYCMIGPNTMITTVNHPLSPKGRKNHIGKGTPVRIGNDVWIGGSYTLQIQKCRSALLS